MRWDEIAGRRDGFPFCAPCGILTQRHKCTLKMHIRGLQQKHKSSFASENIEICREISPDRVLQLPLPSPHLHLRLRRLANAPVSLTTSQKMGKKGEMDGKIVNTENGKSKNPFGHCQLSAFDRDKGLAVRNRDREWDEERELPTPPTLS